MKKLFFVLSVLTLTSCATVFQGTKQQVTITSEPSGAKVYVKNEAIGVTPMTAEIKRKTKSIEVRKEGYQSTQKVLKKGLSGWYIVDLGLCFVGGVGLIPTWVDFLDGACYKITEPNIYIELPKDDGSTKEEIKK